MQFNIVSASNRRIPRKKIIRLMQIVEEDEEPPDSSINIIFIDDKRMTDLNRRFRNKNRATDVLSFKLHDDADDDSVFGEIYISTDSATMNAERYGRSFSDEILLLCCHGFLHLLGYDHEREADFRKMRSREKRYLEKLVP